MAGARGLDIIEAMVPGVSRFVKERNNPKYANPFAGEYDEFVVFGYGSGQQARRHYLADLIEQVVFGCNDLRGTTTVAPSPFAARLSRAKEKA